MTGPRINPIDAMFAGQSSPRQNPIDAMFAAPAPASDPMAKWHAAYKSGALQRRVAIENRNDVGAARDADTADTYLDRLGSMAERAATSVPGGGALLTAERHAITGEPWDVAGHNLAADAQEAADNAPGVTIPKGVPLVGGSRITLADLPAAAAGTRAIARALPSVGGVGIGALTAGATRLSNSPADESAFDTAAGTAGAAALGAVPGMLVKGARYGKATLDAAATPSLDANVVARSGARNAAANAAYDAFRNQPELPMTSGLARMLELPVVKRALNDVRGTDPDLNQLPATHPRVLDAISKLLNNGEWKGRLGVETANASRQLTAAIDDAANQSVEGVPYSSAEQPYATASREIGAVERGARAMQYSGAPKGAPLGAVEDSPAAFREWLNDPARTPEEIQAAREGVLGRLKVEPKFSRIGIGALKVPNPLSPSRALRAAPDLLAQTSGPDMFSRAAGALTQDYPNFTSALRSMFAGRGQAPEMAPEPPAPPPSTPEVRLLGHGDLEPVSGAMQGPGIAQPPINRPMPRLSAPNVRGLLPSAGPIPTPTAGEAIQGPAIPMGRAPLTDANLFGNRITPPSRQLPRGPLITPEPLPNSWADLLRRLPHDAELRRRLGLP